MDNITTDEPLIELSGFSETPTEVSEVMETADSQENTEKPDIDTGFRAHERSLTVPEEVIVYLNQLNASNMVVNARIQAHTKNPVMRFIDGKYAIVDISVSSENPDEQKETVIMTADWHLIGEFRINSFDEEKIPNDIEYVWGFVIRPDDPHTKEVVKVAEALDYGLQPLTFPLVKFEDIGIIEILKAFAFNTLELEYIDQKFSSQLRSYGIFGMYNIQWAENLPKLRAPEWDNILSVVREIVKTKRTEFTTANGRDFNESEKKEAITDAWKQPEVLSLVADYRRKKDAAYEQKMELVNKMKQAMANPASVDFSGLSETSTSTTQTPPVETQKEDIQKEDIQKDLEFALQSVEKAMNAVDEAEIAKKESVGDEIDEII